MLVRKPVSFIRLMDGTQRRTESGWQSAVLMARRESSTPSDGFAVAAVMSRYSFKKQTAPAAIRNSRGLGATFFMILGFLAHKVRNDQGSSESFSLSMQ
jgi:hypothetical protein